MFGGLISRPLRDEQENEAARALTATIWILLLTFPLLLLGIIALPEFSFRWLAILAAVYGVTLPAFVLNRLGYPRVAGISLIIGLWAVASGAALTGGGIASFAALYYLMVVFISGLLLGQRAAIATAGVCIITALGLVVIEMTGYLPSTVIPHTPSSRGLIITLLIVTIMALQYLSVRRVHDALSRSQRELDEHRKTGRELQRVSERLQLATSAANIGIWDWDVINDELVWDDAMYHLYGLRKEDFSGAFDAWAKSLAPEDFDRANDSVQAALRGEGEFGGEFQIVWPDGSVHFTKAASRTFRDETGRSVRMVGVNYDITKRKQAEEALKIAKERSERLINTIDGIVWEADPTTFEFSFVSKQAERFLGYSTEQWLNEPSFWENHIHRDDRDGAVVYFATCTTEMRDHNFEYRMIASDGREVWLRDIVTIEIENDAPKTLRGIMVDITERKRAEHALQRNEDLFRAIVEDQTEMIVRWKPDGTRTFVNQAYCRVFGGDPKDFIGTSFYPQVAEKYRESIRKKVYSLTPAKPLATETHLSISANGQEFWQEWTDRGIFDAQGNLVELQSTGRDITERRRAEEALRESERRLSDTLTNIDMIAVMSDINGDITFCNDHLLRLTNWKREEAIGRNWYEMFLPEYEKEKVSGILAKVEQTGEVTIHLENEIKTRSGERRLVKWTNTMLRGLNGNVIGLAALGDDITERKQAEQQLKESSDQLRALSERLRRAKEEEGIRIARELHDELGSALTSLKWSLLGLDKAYPGSNNSEGHSDARVRIEEMVGLVDATVNTVRRISSELRPGVLDDLGLVSAIEWHAQQLQEQTGMVCQLESLADSVELDRDQATVVFRIFQEAMTNILRHAQATKTNILIEEEDGDFVLEITDNGRGITESEKLGIRSLGLLGMRERANSIGARIVISGNPGKGTRLIVRLPLTSGVAV